MEHFLFNTIKYLKGVGPKRAELFKKLGIETVYDLLYHFPRSYIDFTHPIGIKDAPDGENSVIKANVTKKIRGAKLRGGLTIYKAVVNDGIDDMTIVIYNSEYIYDKMVEGEEFLFYGKVQGSTYRKEMSSPLIVECDKDVQMMPIYPLTDGISRQVTENAIKSALLNLQKENFEPISNEIRAENEISTLSYALQHIHFPQGEESLEIARKRLVFEELLVLQLGMALLKAKNSVITGYTMDKQVGMSEFFDQLKFQLTNAQKRSIRECLLNMCAKAPMNRLLQGDVGSGKTVVAAACCFFVHKNSFQSALMAPTEILATQHYENLKELLEPIGVRVCLLTGSLSPKQKGEIKKLIQLGYYSVIVGTHAIIQESTVFKSLALVITDEQHRFGVEQRALLAQKGANPHKLVMSATPIPRTLALMIYGNLDISVLDELPKGRQPIETYAITGKLRDRAFTFIKGQLDEGRQAYIVCPAIDEGELDVKAVQAYADSIKKGAFADYSISVMHGKLHASEKERIMQDFKQGKTDMLVSTTVIEVGVDVPNASVIVIEDSDRFGLSQLHQLRGRVGRGKHKSHCILITDHVTEDAKKRLQILSKTSDGFEISEQDLKLRGPGDFFGNKQHGLPKMRIADLANDLDVLKKVKSTADKILEDDKELAKNENKELKMLVSMLFDNGYELD